MLYCGRKVSFENNSDSEFSNLDSEDDVRDCHATESSSSDWNFSEITVSNSLFPLQFLLELFVIPCNNDGKPNN